MQSTDSGKPFSNKIKAEAKAEANGKCVFCVDKQIQVLQEKREIQIIQYQNLEMETTRKRMHNIHVRIAIKY